MAGDRARPGAAGDLQAALDGVQESLRLSDTLISRVLGCGASGAMFVALDRFDEAQSMVERASGLGPALGRHEARWAAAELAVARGDRGAGRRVDEALEMAERGGALVYRPRLSGLRELVADAGES